jgi:hypothetical protein
LVAAGRGLPIPAADEIPDELLTRPLSPDSPHASNHNLHNLMVPIGSRSHSAASDASATISPSHPAFSNATSPTSAAPPSPSQSSSPFRPRSKTLASLTTSSKNPTSSEIVPREIQLPKDPYVNGQAIEVFLYKDASECPICFLYYPPYLNKTRCCDQPICSECFVQIKRPDPHPPEHHDPSQPVPPPTEADPEALVCEPAVCPYCQQSEFGVTYEPPPFRRGLVYANSNHGLAGFSSAMSSSTSLNSQTSPSLSPNTHKRRTTSISANASTVITTDRVRPDWATKLANARSHLARRAAAATALHTAAYLIGSGSTDNRSFGFSGRSRFGRNRGNSDSPSASGAATPSPTTAEPGTARSVSEQIQLMRREVHENGGTRRRNRMEDLEEMMMLEAIRLSLAEQEEAKKKADKEAAKEAKKKAKEDKKKEKKERKVYGSGPSSASGSALSLSLPGLGRRRGNSGASNLQREVTVEDAEPSNIKGKGVDRGFANASSTSSPIDFPRSGSSLGGGFPGARHLDTTTLASINDSHQISPSPTAPEKPSHLRQMSNASSPASSFIESIPGSLRNNLHAHGSTSTLDSPNASGTNLLAHSGSTPDGGDTSGSAGIEPMFNFQSLTAMINNEDEKADKDHVEIADEGGESSRQNSRENTSGTALDGMNGLEESIATLKVEDSQFKGNGDAESRQTTLLEPQRTTPEVMLTPETPAAINHGDDDGKQLGSNWNRESTTEITQ